MVALFNKAMVAALLVSTAASSPLNTHVGVPVNDLSQLGSGKASIKQGKRASL